MEPSQNQEVLTESAVEENDINNTRFVPVTESIRYRKRAQSAEKKVENLSEQLTQAESHVTEMSKELNDIRIEQKLTEKLTSVGVIDLEAALLICKTRLASSGETDLDACVKELQKEKRYLFVNKDVTNNVVQKTAGAKERTTNSQILERAAKKAATTGNRTDLQEYLKLRRNFV